MDEVLFGCVLPAGQGQAPARQAARGAGLPDAVGATTVNKVCGSGMKATMLAHDLILAGSAIDRGFRRHGVDVERTLSACQARGGYRVGHDRIFDHMMLDGLEDAYEQGRSMGDFGELAVEAYQFSRDDQDAYAVETLTRARKAHRDGRIRGEITPISVAAKGGPVVIGQETSIRRRSRRRKSRR